jgi:hypothetical protein
MTEKTLLLVEDTPQDELLTLRALKKANVANRIDVVRDGSRRWITCSARASSLIATAPTCPP